MIRPCELHYAVLFALSWVANAVTVTYNSSALPFKPPLALTLIRDRDDSCTVTSLVSTQKHRLLRDYQDVAMERKLFKDARHDFVSGIEQLQLIGYVPNNLWMIAQELCPDLTSAQEPLGNFSLMARTQHTFSATRLAKTTDLELYPLVQSGPSENRVDLTFFADGCM